MNPTSVPRFLRTHQVESIYGLTRKYLATCRTEGSGPPYVKVSGKLVLYEIEALEAWLSARRRQSTSDPGGEE